MGRSAKGGHADAALTSSNRKGAESGGSVLLPALLRPAWRSLCGAGTPSPGTRTPHSSWDPITGAGTPTQELGPHTGAGTPTQELGPHHRSWDPHTGAGTPSQELGPPPQELGPPAQELGLHTEAGTRRPPSTHTQELGSPRRSSVGSQAVVQYIVVPPAPEAAKYMFKTATAL